MSFESCFITFLADEKTNWKSICRRHISASLQYVSASEKFKYVDNAMVSCIRTSNCIGSAADILHVKCFTVALSSSVIGRIG